MIESYPLDKFTKEYGNICTTKDRIDPTLFKEYGVNRGLRDQNGKGVLAGLTNVSRIDAFKMVDGKKVPCDGQLWYRGYNVIDLVKGFQDKRYGYEEVAYLLLFGELPNLEQIRRFNSMLVAARTLPTNFTRDVIMKAPSKDLMNSITRSVLTLASYDDQISNPELSNVLRQCMALISEFPMLAVYGYQAYNHYINDDSLYIHRPDPHLSTAENILLMLRPDKKYTDLEARVLDIALVLHMEHGGGNNSTFTTRVVTSSGSDTYSVVAAALSSLKGPKHGGANIKVVEMMQDLKANVSDPTDEEAVADYLEKCLAGEAFDHKGLIYGMGHAVYSLSDPRARVFKRFVKKLASEKDRGDDFALYAMVEQLAPQIISGERHIFKGVSANVDFYSGFVYSMLDIPLELYTPIFAIARIVGWSAHRIEELVNADKIIRPAYQSVMEPRPYRHLKDR
ncbi:MAG: citrate/2-methylcitrate synthase [Eubacteriaceae bacterium]|nr:citrate/2-methylcitrate synthase [Eubacteriaceae bacterium]MDD4507348.1 citrate/2-methylcitrate synthase [Eubacteriaceae bacterium]